MKIININLLIGSFVFFISASTSFKLFGFQKSDSLEALKMYQLAEKHHESPSLYLEYATKAIPLLKKIKFGTLIFLQSFPYYTVILNKISMN